MVVDINGEALRAEIKRIASALNMTQVAISESVTGTKSTLSAAMASGRINEDHIVKMEALYGLKRDGIIIVPEPGEETLFKEAEKPTTHAVDISETNKLLAELIASVNEMKNEMVTVRMAVKHIEATSKTTAEELVKRPFPVAPEQLAGIIERCAVVDHSGEVYRAIKQAQESIKDAVAWGIRKADRQREEDSKKK